MSSGESFSREIHEALAKERTFSCDGVTEKWEVGGGAQSERKVTGSLSPSYVPTMFPALSRLFHTTTSFPPGRPDTEETLATNKLSLDSAVSIRDAIKKIKKGPSKDLS